MRVSLEETEEDTKRHREDRDLNVAAELEVIHSQVKKHQR